MSVPAPAQGPSCPAEIVQSHTSTGEGVQDHHSTEPPHHDDHDLEQGRSIAPSANPSVHTLAHRSNVLSPSGSSTPKTGKRSVQGRGGGESQSSACHTSASSVPAEGELITVVARIDPLMKTSKGIALLTTLFAATATAILNTLRVDEQIKDATGSAMTAANIASYIAIISNMLASAASVLMVYRLDHIICLEAHMMGPRFDEKYNNTKLSAFQLLRRFGGGWDLPFLFIQLTMYTALGALAIYAQILLYVLLHDGTAQACGLAALIILALFMLALTFRFIRTLLFPCCGGRN